MSNETKCANPSCGKKIKQTKGKRAKKYCNSTCRSSHFQKKKRSEKKLVFHGPDNDIKLSENKTKKDKNRKGATVTVYTMPKKEFYDGPEMKSITIDEYPMYQKSQPAKVTALTKEIRRSPQENSSIDTRPKNLKELKALCPASLCGLERSAWISSERKKYNI